MSRQTMLLAVLGAVLLLVVGYLFAIKPRQDEVAEIRAEIETTREQQAQVEAQITALEQVRATSPEVEATLAAAETVIPRDDARLAAAVRQLQVAATDSGTQLSSISLSRPAAVTSDTGPTPADLTSIAVSVTVDGGYYQIVDFLRRVEDPVITPRAVLWDSASVSLLEYPTLTANLTGTMFAYLEDISAEPAPAPEPTDSETDVDVDVDVDVTQTEDAA